LVSLEIFIWHNPSSCTMVLGLTQLPTEMSTRNISLEVKASGAYGWQLYHLHAPIVLKSGSLNLLKHSGPVQALMGLLYIITYQSGVKSDAMTAGPMGAKRRELIVA